MHFSTKTIALVASLLSTAEAGALLGFNYGATKTDGSLMQQADFESLFTKAQNLAGTSGWNSARLYTSIQGATGQPISAIPAAISTKTKLLLGLWGSSGPDTINSEIDAIKAAIAQYKTDFTDLVVGISVGSEDLYRKSIIGVQTNAGIGEDPTVIANYIKQTKQALAGTALSNVKVGHVDTWTAWYNTSNQAVIDASDFIGVDTYPYFQNTMPNSIDLSRALFDEAVANTRSTTAGKEIWITETGFPTGGPTSNQAVPSVKDAKTYWDQVGCAELFNVTNTFWYTLQDEIAAELPASSPKFGLLDINGKEQFDLSCNSISKTPTSSTSATGTATSATGSNTASIVDGGSPGVSQGGAGSAPAGVTSTASVSGGSGSGSGSGSATASGSGSVPSSGGSTVSPVQTVITTTNSAGEMVTSTAIVNGTGIQTGTPISPTASTSAPPTGAAAGLAAPVVGVLGALMAALAL